LRSALDLLALDALTRLMIPELSSHRQCRTQGRRGRSEFVPSTKRDLLLSKDHAYMQFRFTREASDVPTVMY
jgi:hypothetical protein